MSKIVEKWVAGFWSDKVIVVKWKFRETPKTFIMVKEDDPTIRLLGRSGRPTLLKREGNHHQVEGSDR